MSTPLAKEDHARDAAFSKAMHGKSAGQKSAFMAMLSKDSKTQEIVADEYFRHFDNKKASIETEKDREVNTDLLVCNDLTDRSRTGKTTMQP